MCCIVAKILKIIIIAISILLLVGIGIGMVNDLTRLRAAVSVQDHVSNVTIWLLHCFCGILMTVLKLKDQCFLYWWQLMTLAICIGVLYINFLLPESAGLNVGQKASEYFVLEYMLITLLAVALYTRSLRTQENAL